MFERFTKDAREAVIRGLGVRVLADAKVDLRVLRHDVIAAMPAFTP